MAHGITPPFSGHLVARDFVTKCPLDREIESDMLLLGNAGNSVVVVREVAEMLQTILRRIRFYLTASGYPNIVEQGGQSDLSTIRLMSLMLGSALDIDDANALLNLILPALKDSRESNWRVLVNGPLNYRSQLVEDAVGIVIKEGAKDVCLTASHDAGIEKIEMVLGAA